MIGKCEIAPAPAPVHPYCSSLGGVRLKSAPCTNPQQPQQPAEHANGMPITAAVSQSLDITPALTLRAASGARVRGLPTTQPSG